MTQAPTRVLLLHARFNMPSFWDYFVSARVAGRRAPGPPLGLLTVAALLPDDWELRLIDRNIDRVREADLDWADLVMTGGMLPQRPDVIHLIDRCRARGTPVIVGGPDVSSSPEAFAEADFRLVGEAEEVIADFIAAWRSGERQGFYEARKFSVDVTRTPPPRYDLIDLNDYLTANVQFSRGCPFNCEFCDIIELYGRRPRTKTAEQVLAELDAIFARGYRGTVFFVDDNLIGNKKELKQVLPRVIAWQRERNYPFGLFTQASINLADDDELLALMRDAGFEMVFIGIESPNAETLVSTQKKQNTRRDLVESVHRLYDAGLFVMAGFILGFDTDKDGVADELAAYIEAADIPVSMIGTLIALPGTQLERRLAAEGRLQDGMLTEGMKEGQLGDQCTTGPNFDTLRPRRDLLRDFQGVLERVYSPKAFFGRVRSSAARLKPACHHVRSRRDVITDTWLLARIFGYVLVRRPTCFLPFVSCFAACARTNPGALTSVVTNALLYLHLGPFARFVRGRLEDEIARLDAGAGAAPVTTRDAKSRIRAHAA